MNFFGYTLLGPQNYIKDCLRCEYREPSNNKDVMKIMEKIKDTNSDVEAIRTIDCYIGRVNGFAYGSSQRFVKMKRKGLNKPIGPSEIYRYPVAQSQEYGWFYHDTELTSTTWHHTSPRYPQPVSPNSLILDIVRKNDKYASLF